jgi:hypothetical protein
MYAQGQGVARITATARGRALAATDPARLHRLPPWPAAGADRDENAIAPMLLKLSDNAEAVVAPGFVDRAMGNQIPLDPGIGGRSIGAGALVNADIIVSTTRAGVSGIIRIRTDYALLNCFNNPSPFFI